MLLYALVSAFSVAAFGLSVTGESILPVTTCKRDSADYSACLKSAIEEALPRFIPGLPEFNFPSLDPLFYEYGKAVFKSGDIRGEIIVSNVTTIGLENTQILDVRANLIDDIFRLEIDTQIPRLFLKGHISLDGSISVFRVNSKGYFNITGDDVRTTWDITGHVVNDTWIIKHFRAFPSFRTFKVHSDFLAEQSKEISDIVVSFVNEFWPALQRAMVPLASKEWDSWLTNLTNKLFSKVSFSKIFP